MNRRWFALILILSLLPGCAGENDETAPSEALYDTKPAETVGFASFYEVPDTGGAVRGVPLNTRDADGFRFAGEDILVFSGYGATDLTLLEKETLYIKAKAILPCTVFPEDPGVTAGPKGITYVDIESRELVFLNALLEESARISLPEDCGNAVLSADQALLYYSTADALRVLELDTGVDRPLKEMSFPCQEVTALHCDGTVLQCSVIYDDGTTRTLFISTETGILLQETSEDIPLWTAGDLYFAAHMDGAYRELISGSPHFGPSLLVTESEPVAVHSLLEQRTVLLQSQDAAGCTVLDCYHLETGANTAQVTLPDSYEVTAVLPEPESHLVWFLCHDRDSDRDMLCRWDPELSKLEDSSCYLQSRWDREHPDIDGLNQCREQAAQLSDAHGVQILLWTDATECLPPDLRLEPEYQVPLILRMLQDLDTALSCYPEGFLKELAAATPSGKLNICPVRNIAADAASSRLYWDVGNDVYLILTPGQDFTEQLHALVCDLIDSRVIGNSDAYDGWNRSDSSGIGHRERVRILKTAMADGQAAYFASGYMQSTLRQLCLGIRETFRTAKAAEALPWEQYLLTKP